MDIGTSSIAVCSKNDVFLQQLGAKIEKIDKEIVRTLKRVNSRMMYAEGLLSFGVEHDEAESLYQCVSDTFN